MIAKITDKVRMAEPGFVTRSSNTIGDTAFFVFPLAPGADSVSTDPLTMRCRHRGGNGYDKGHLLRNRHVLHIAAAFLAGIAVAIVLPRLINSLGKMLLAEHREEIARITSPDGSVDAVMVNSDCGALCATITFVTVVAKGKKAPDDPGQYVFSADDTVNPRLLWKQSHLLEIAYDKAFINSFRNGCYPFGVPGNVESWKYEVEIRLAPSSAGFSYLPENKR